MMNAKKTTKSNGGLVVIDVVCINTIMLKVFGVEPVSRWPWLIVLSPWLVYIGLIAILALVASYFKKQKELKN